MSVIFLKTEFWWSIQIKLGFLLDVMLNEAAWLRCPKCVL
jgi:hypothetical protein